MENFTPVSALIGGLMIGASAALFLVFNGRIAGISGILGGLIPPERGQIGWRLAFLAGMFIAPLAYVALGGALPAIGLDASLPWWLVLVAALFTLARFSEAFLILKVADVGLGSATCRPCSSS